ncbi:2TM domain-containing protein [Dickeya dianthicola]|uniref:2TM domain-containing protein n=1 Tax=Dickeya dianthicola TaxID=204039 RepID=UPI0021F81082|nr:2TM domain-containing protein [Dickeya dianthicola]
MFAINSLVNPQTRWFLWPLLMWGGVLAVRVFWLRDRWSRWEQERLQKILRKP